MQLVFYFRRFNFYTICMLSFQITFKHEGILHLAEACNLMNKENICA